MFKNILKFFLKDKIIIFWVILSLSLIALMLINLFKIPKTSDPIPLHYNIYFGIDYLGAWKKIFIIPLLAFLVFLINFTLALFLYFKNKFISYLFCGTSLYVQIIFLISSLTITWINT